MGTASRPSPTRVRGLLGMGIILVVVSGCAGRPEPPFPMTPDTTPARTRAASPSPRTPEATPSPALANHEVAIGDTIAITREGTSWAALTVTEVVVERSFADPEGQGGDSPDSTGNVFVAAHVTISALADTAAFELAGFRASTASGDEVPLTFSDLGPQPELLAGTLEGRGDAVSGWLLFEAPEAGRLRLSYEHGPATTAPLVIVLRGS